MRKKKRESLVAANLNKAWAQFFEEVSACDPADLKKEGWMTNEEIAEISKLNFNAGRQIADHAVREGKLELRNFKVMLGGKRRNVNFYRPVGKECQRRANGIVKG